MEEFMIGLVGGLLSGLCIGLAMAFSHYEADAIKAGVAEYHQPDPTSPRTEFRYKTELVPSKEK